ncbi:MAG: EAL domain-containing protein [Sphingobium sp.]
MRCPRAIDDEDSRLAALTEHGLSAGVAVPSLDPIVEIAVRLFDVPAAAVNMIGSDHVFFASSYGIGECDMSRDSSFCAHAITQDAVMVVPDAQLDPRFHDNPLVTAGMIRFYAGVPLRAPSGHAMGALCIVDPEPRAGLDEQDRARLRDLARMASDKLELRRLEVANAHAPSGFAAIAATSPNAVICFERSRRITVWNPAAMTMFGYSAQEAVGRDILTIIPPHQHGIIQRVIDRAIEAKAPPVADIGLLKGVRKDGTRFPVELSWSYWHDRGEPFFGAIVQDVTGRLQQEDALYRLANFDSLTRLPNRHLLHTRGAAALAAEESVATVLIDLEGFKDINDTLGQSVGDAVLCEIAARLVEAVPEAAMVARVGGDEFAVLLPGAGNPLSISAMAERLVGAISRPIAGDGHDISIAASCGFAIAPQHGQTIEDLLGSADLALSHARATGYAGSFLYTPSLRAEAAARRMHDAELRRAVERGEFRLHYQPQVRLSNGCLVGAEALIRWQHPVRHLLQPAAFLSALERGPLAAQVGNWVLDAACAQAALWRDSQPDFRIGVNLFPAQFRAGDLAARVAAALDRHSQPAPALELEITENIVLDQVKLVLPQLMAVQALGVALAFDDFGTGYASLNMLKKYPITHIKIDKSFVQTMLDSPPDRAIVTSLIDLSHQLDLKVIAEGIETDEQRTLLRGHGCEEGQGYYFGRPMTADLFAEKFGLTGDGRRAVA